MVSYRNPKPPLHRSFGKIKLLSLANGFPTMSPPNSIRGMPLKENFILFCEAEIIRNRNPDPGVMSHILIDTQCSSEWEY